MVPIHRIVYFVVLVLLIVAVVYGSYHGWGPYPVIAFFAWIIAWGAYYAFKKDIQ